jgi:hypothetical protein
MTPVLTCSFSGSFLSGRVWTEGTTLCFDSDDTSDPGARDFKSSAAMSILYSDRSMCKHFLVKSKINLNCWRFGIRTARWHPSWELGRHLSVAHQPVPRKVRAVRKSQIQLDAIAFAENTIQPAVFTLNTHQLFLRISGPFTIIEVS